MALTRPASRGLRETSKLSTSTGVSIFSPASEDSSSILSDAIDATVRLFYPFTTIENFFQLVSTAADNDYLAFHGVTEDDFDSINEAREKHRPKFRLRRFLAKAQVLYITVPSRAHEVMHTSIYHQFLLQLNQAGLFSQWVSFAATTYRAQSGHPRGDGGEGDSTGGPKPARLFKGAWPTFVIEAGMSETMNALHSDMRWWFTTSQHAVKIVLLVKFDSAQQSIILERWEEEGPRPGATATRSAAEIEPVLRQTISITMDVTEQGKYNVARGDLVLSFRLSFLREPGPGEGDIVIRVATLKECAETVWAIL